MTNTWKVTVIVIDEHGKKTIIERYGYSVCGTIEKAVDFVEDNTQVKRLPIKYEITAEILE